MSMRTPLRPPRWPFAPREAMDVCSVFTSRRGIQDIVARALWTPTGTAVTAADIGPTDALVAGSPTAWDLRDTSSTSYVTLNAKAQQGRTSYTVLACGVSVGASGNDYRGIVGRLGGLSSGSGNMFSIKDNGGGLTNPHIYLQIRSGGVQKTANVYFGQRVWYGNSASHTWIGGVVIDGASYCRGVAGDVTAQTLVTSDVASWTAGPDTGSSDMILAARYGADTLVGDIALAWVGAWPRALSVDEIGDIVARPWSIVEEYSAKTYFLPLVLGGGGGGGSFQPAWAARSTTTIVGGVMA